MGLAGRSATGSAMAPLFPRALDAKGAKRFPALAFLAAHPAALPVAPNRPVVGAAVELRAQAQLMSRRVAVGEVEPHLIRLEPRLREGDRDLPAVVGDAGRDDRRH